jgi:fructose-specific phosphotransferase system IIB component
MKMVAVTACPTGIAHTYMAAAKLEFAAKELGHEIKVETQGAMGIENELSSSDIASASVAIFAVDIVIEAEERFSKLSQIKVPVQEALKDPHGIFRKAEAAAGKKG